MGPRLGRYEVLKHLASGGMADVLLGRTAGIEGFERHVVLKRIKPEHARDQRFIRMFLDEARVAANLHHQHIVQVHDIGEAAGEYFIAMEYLHGEDVRTMLSTASKMRQHVPLGYAMAIVSAAAAGLHYAHERRGPDKRPLGIVHRDISPSNILVGYDGSIKVVDFGIAKASARQDTRSGALKGKVSYMSPEQCKSGAVDRRSDVYSLGVVLYELATTTRLFKGESDYLVMDQIVNGRVPLPQVRRPDLPGELSAIIMRAIAPDPERRFATADELRVALDQFAGKLGLAASTSAIAAYMRAQFGDKPEPWLELGDHTAAPLDPAGGSGSGVRPGQGWTELWRSDDPAQPGTGNFARPRGAIGSGTLPRPSRALGTGAGEARPEAGAETRSRRVERPSTAPTDARMGWESQPSTRARRGRSAKLAVIGAPLIAIVGAGIWWFDGAGASPAAAVSVAPAAQAVPAPAATAAPIPAPAPVQVAASPPPEPAAPVAEPAPERARTPARNLQISAGEPAKRSGASRKPSAAKIAEPRAPAAPALGAPAAPPGPPRPPASPVPGAAPPGASLVITSLTPPTERSAAPAAPPRPAGSLAPAAPAAANSSAPAGPAVQPAAPPPPAVEPAPAQLSHAMVDRVASDHTRELSKCDGGEELHGEITVRFAVDAGGRVTKAQVATTLKKPKLAACILRSVQKWQFPPQPGGGAQGTYTLSFQ